MSWINFGELAGQRRVNIIILDPIFKKLGTYTQFLVLCTAHLDLLSIDLLGCVWLGWKQVGWKIKKKENRVENVVFHYLVKERK